MLLEQAELSRVGLLKRMLTPTRLIVPAALHAQFVSEVVGRFGPLPMGLANLHVNGMKVIFSSDATEIEAAFVLDKE